MFKYHTALLLDGLSFFAKSIDSLGPKVLKLPKLSKSTLCSFDQRKESPEILSLLKRSNYMGLTGKISFNQFGIRNNYEIIIYKVNRKTPLKTVSIFQILMNITL